LTANHPRRESNDSRQRPTSPESTRGFVVR